MSFTKKNLVLFSFILFAFTACILNFLAHKSGQLFFDFSSFAPEKNSNSRSAIEDYVEDGKDYYIDLTIDGSYKFSATIDLKDVNTYTIDNIPVGTRIKAKIDFYTYNIPGDLYSRETLLSGESKYYTITAGVNEIVINLKSEFIKLYVTKNESIQDKIDWIAQNGNSEKDYKIILTGYEDEPFNEVIEFKSNLNNRASSITLTSSNPNNVAIKTPTYLSYPDNPSSIVVNTYTNIIFENIKISPDCNFAILQTNSDSFVTLGQGTVFEDNKSHVNAIFMNGGTIHMKGNSNISGFKSPASGGAVEIKYGQLYMYDNSKIENCETEQDGGAIYIQYSGSTYFELNDNAKINDCKARYDGGAIYVKGNSILIKSGSITNCNAGNSGGAIYTDETNTQPIVYIKGGIIKNNTASQKGSAIYLGGSNSQVIMSENACIDLSNDIYSQGQAILLSNALKTPGQAAIISYSSLSADNPKLVLGFTSSPYNTNDEQAVSKSHSKFFVREVLASNENHYYIDENGKAIKFSSFLTAPASPEDTDNQIQLGDIVFADNSRIRATDFDKIDYKLYSSIAGIVFYVGSDDGFLGNTNLIVGTKYYTGNFEKQAYSSTSVFPHFDKTNIKSFPNYASNYDNGDTSPDKSTKSISEINEEDYLNIEKESINSGITSDLLSRIKNGYFPLYSKVINYGKEEKFESTRYSYDETSNVANNWYVPRIEEYIVFAQALEDPYIKNLYIKISGDNLKGDYISESIMWSKYTIPAHCAYGMLNKTYYPYNFGINFETDSIIQLVTPPFNYEEHKAFPIHIYTPGD